MTSRRSFLHDCTVLAATAALNPTPWLSASAFRADAPAGRPGLAAFAARVGTTFRVAIPAQPAVGLCLTRAEALHQAGDADPERQFSLLFRGPGDRPLTQDTYTMEHAGLGSIAVFIVPVLAREHGHQYYEAIFNHCPGPAV